MKKYLDVRFLIGVGAFGFTIAFIDVLFISKVDEVRELNDLSLAGKIGVSILMAILVYFLILAIWAFIKPKNK